MQGCKATRPTRLLFPTFSTTLFTLSWEAPSEMPMSSWANIFFHGKGKQQCCNVLSIGKLVKRLQVRGVKMHSFQELTLTRRTGLRSREAKLERRTWMQIKQLIFRQPDPADPAAFFSSKRPTKAMFDHWALCRCVMFIQCSFTRFTRFTRSILAVFLPILTILLFTRWRLCLILLILLVRGGLICLKASCEGRPSSFTFVVGSCHATTSHELHRSPATNHLKKWKSDTRLTM